MNDAKQATPAAELERQICSATEPKNEREWWAHREIERLRDRLSVETLALVETLARAERAEANAANWEEQANDRVSDWDEVRAERDALRAEAAALWSAIRWALGENGNFSDEPYRCQASVALRYWWRAELRRRADAARAGGEDA